MIDDVFPHFFATADQTPNKFSNLLKGWSVNWNQKHGKTKVKTAYLCQKHGENTDKNSIFAEHIVLIAWFDPKTMKNT